MKLQPWLMLLLATLLMAAAPPVRQAASPSAWDKLKNSAQRLLPKASVRPQSAQQRNLPDASVNSGRSGSALSGQPANMRRDPQVRQATVVEPARPKPAPAAHGTRRPSRSGLFSREKRPSRTLSQYMAQEKP
jgi:hypothetical protein